MITDHQLIEIIGGLDKKALNSLASIRITNRLPSETGYEYLKYPHISLNIGFYYLL